MISCVCKKTIDERKKLRRVVSVSDREILRTSISANATLSSGVEQTIDIRDDDSASNSERSLQNDEFVTEK